MSLHVTVPGADYSALNRGNTSLAETHIKNANITDAKFKTALRAFHNSFKLAGFLKKFNVGRLYFAGTALADSINLVNPILGAAANQATFINDDPQFHTLAGWKPNSATSHYAQSNFPLVGDLTNFHMHAWNTTSEATDVASRFLLGSQSASNHQLNLGRRVVSVSTRVDIGTFSPNTPLNFSNDTAATGLISVARNGTSLKMFRNGVMQVQSTKSDSPTAAVGAAMKEGVVDPTSPTSITNCTLRFIGYGYSSWTDSDEAALKVMIDAFNTAIA